MIYITEDEIKMMVPKMAAMSSAMIAVYADGIEAVLTGMGLKTNKVGFADGIKLGIVRWLQQLTGSSSGFQSESIKGYSYSKGKVGLGGIPEDVLMILKPWLSSTVTFATIELDFENVLPTVD